MFPLQMFPVTPSSSIGRGGGRGDKDFLNPGRILFTNFLSGFLFSFLLSFSVQLLALLFARLLYWIQGWGFWLSFQLWCSYLLGLGLLVKHSFGLFTHRRFHKILI